MSNEIENLGKYDLVLLIKSLRDQYTIINTISNANRREPADTGRLKRAGENMELILRQLEDLACIPKLP